MGQPKISPLFAALQGGQPPYQLLTANFSKPHTPEFGTGTGSNPIRTRSGFRWQNTSWLGFAPGSSSETSNPVVATGTGSLLTPPPWTNQTGSLTVVDNDFSTGAAHLFLGPFVLVAGDDFAIGALVGDTATNIAAAISNLPGYSAAPAGAVVNVTGPLGSQNVSWTAKFFGSVRNFDTFTPDTGFLALGDPQRGGDVILPA